jgi:hypothetical protein
LPASKQEQEAINALDNASICNVQNISPKVFDPDHRYKQHFGVLKGAEALLGMCTDITHFVKIRTDMLMPETFWEWVFDISGKDDKKLYISELMFRPFYQGDFIYLADRDVFLAFLKTVVSYRSRIIHPSIAFDMGIKNCESRDFGVLYKCNLVGRMIFLVDFFFRTGVMRKNWNVFIGKYVGVMPESIWLEMQWRGRSIGSFLNSSPFKFDTLEITGDINLFDNIRNLIREYRTYLTKCLKSRRAWWP